MNEKIVLVETVAGVAECTLLPADVQVYFVNWDDAENGNCPWCGQRVDIDITQHANGMHATCYFHYLSIIDKGSGMGYDGRCQ